MSTHPKLKVEPRTVFGKKLKKLRREGILPANVYGKDVKSTALQVNLKEFETLFKEVGETGLVDIEVEGKARPVLFHNVHWNYSTNTPLHADFYQVNLSEKIKTMVPIEIVGTPTAVTENVGILLHTLNEIEVEALPEELPERFEINVEPLTAVDQQITVGDIKVPTGVTVHTDPELVIVKISELVSKETEEVLAEQAAELEAAAAEVEAEKAEEAPAEGEPSSAEATEGQGSEGAEGEVPAEPSSAEVSEGQGQKGAEQADKPQEDKKV